MSIKFGALNQVQRTEVGITAIYGLVAAFFYKCSTSTLGKTAHLCWHSKEAADQFLQLFFKSIGVVKDCLQSFNPDICRDDNVCDSRKLSEYLFGKGHELILMILFFAFAGETGNTFKENKTEDDNAARDRLCNHSGRISLNRYPTSRNLVRAGGRIRSPLKQTGLYEKGDCYQ